MNDNDMVFKIVISACIIVLFLWNLVTLYWVGAIDKENSDLDLSHSALSERQDFDSKSIYRDIRYLQDRVTEIESQSE